MHRAHLLLLTLTITTLPAHAEKEPDLYAYITHVTSPTDFDIDGLHVHLTSGTTLQLKSGKNVTPILAANPFVGQLTQAWGKLDRKNLTIDTSRIVFYEARPYVVKGSAIIDAVLPSPTGQVHLLRADGRFLAVSSSVLDHPVALPSGALPPAVPTDLRTNVWIDYTGQRGADGIVTLDTATFAENAVTRPEEKLRAKHEYDPAAVPAGAQQTLDSKLVKGTGFKQIPPLRDEATQARIDRIGNSLIPAFQRALAATDPTLIHFRFQLVDQPKRPEAHSLPSGIILVPAHIARRLDDDSMLAAILADGIATALEKQTYRLQGKAHALAAAEIAGAALQVMPGVGLLGSAAGLGGMIGTSDARHRMLTEAQAQSGRVALALMFDAGYDIDKAPEAWWILATKPGRAPHGASAPDRAANQYDELGSTWQPANRQKLNTTR